jgi:hypothetical protein
MPNTFTYDLDSIESIININLQKDLDNFINDMSASVKVLQAQGMANEDILRRLVDDFKSKSGAWQSLEGKLGSTIDFGLANASNFSANSAVVAAFPNARGFEWVLDPTVVQHCSDCLDKSNMKPQSYAIWEQLGLPAEGYDECGSYCCCTLIPS